MSIASVAQPGLHQSPPPQQPAVRVQAFRQFASNLAAQVVEQLCVEYEREVSAMTNDLMMYRNELARVAELLAHQLGRERQLHAMLDTMAGHHANLANASAQAATQQPNKDELHNMVEAMFGQHANTIQATFHGMNQANEITQTHHAQAKQLQEQSVTAENELNRILHLLGAPPIQAVSPAPTTAGVPPHMQQQRHMATPPNTPGPCRPAGPMYGPRPGFAGSPAHGAPPGMMAGHPAAGHCVSTGMMVNGPTSCTAPPGVACVSAPQVTYSHQYA